MRMRSYVPDLTRFSGLCEANYARLERLRRLNGERSDGAQGIRFALHHGDDYLGAVAMSRLQVARYTETWMLEQVHNAGRWLNNPRMTVRCYHDARMSEVISCYRHQRVRAVNDYPNRYMHHPDEKLQINGFLAEWLDFCLKFGHVAGLTSLWTPEV